MTPLVDVVFLLIIFFVLVTRISSANQVELDLARLEEVHLVEPPTDGQLVVNVMPAGSGGVWCRFGAAYVEDAEGRVERLVAFLVSQVRVNAELGVTVRASRGEPYARVHDVLEACRLAGVVSVHLVCEPVEDEG